jgi:hypothetical protein
LHKYKPYSFFPQTAAIAPAQGSNEKEEPADSRSTGMSLIRCQIPSVYIIFIPNLNKGVGHEDLK